jgi:hypothetical protein
MSTIVFEIEQLYNQFFGSKPVVPKEGTNAKADTKFVIGGLPKKTGLEFLPVVNSFNNKVQFTNQGNQLYDVDVKGVEIWLPTKLFNLPFTINGSNQVKLPYSVISISGGTNIVRTTVSERKGTVKELYNIDDYKISIKGFFIDKERRVWPEDDIIMLKKLHESGEAFGLDNALTNPFLQDNTIPDMEQQRVVMTGFSLPEVEGGRKHIRPFVMNLESDSVFTLEYA